MEKNKLTILQQFLHNHKNDIVFEMLSIQLLVQTVEIYDFFEYNIIKMNATSIGLQSMLTVVMKCLKYN